MASRHLQVGIISLLVSTALALTAGGCAPFAPGPRPDAAGVVPASYSLYGPSVEAPPHWWESFDSPELDRLVVTALADNLAIGEAWARLRQARAVSVQVGAARYPDLFLDGGASASRRRSDSGDPGGSDTRTSEDYGLGFSSSYEIDLWGRVRSETEAALLETSASREDLNTAAMTLAATVTQRWLRIIAQREEIDLLREQLRTNETLLELVTLRYRKAMVSSLDVYQQKQVVEQVRAQIPLAEAEEQLLRHEMAVLLGKPPLAVFGIRQETLPPMLPLPDAGFPADLLAARPDVRAAGLRLRASDWQVAAARANRLPDLRLSVGGAYGAESLDLLFDNWILTLAGSLTAPVLDGGRRAAEVDRARAAADADLSAYRLAVLTAVKEVEDALVGEAKQQEHLEALRQQRDAAGRALKEAGERYRNGIQDYLPVLTQLLAVQGLDRELIRRETLLRIERVSLYRALGGQWTDGLTPEAGLGAKDTDRNSNHDG
jgi:NodT family efflux transporter outer membrane factor (OMF) lipoprotein